MNHDSGNQDSNKEYNESGGEKRSREDSFDTHGGTSPPDEINMSLENDGQSIVEMLAEGTFAENANPGAYISPSKKSRRTPFDPQKLERYSAQAPNQFHKSTHRNPSGFLSSEIVMGISVLPRWSWYRSKSKEDQRKINHQVREVVSKLAPKQRKVVELLWGLNDGREKSQREVAEIMGVAQQTVSEHWKAAQKQFSKWWVKKGFPLRDK